MSKSVNAASGQALRKRDGIAIEKSADALDELQYASARDLAIRNADRDSTLLREVKAAMLRSDDSEDDIEFHSEISTKRLEAARVGGFPARPSSLDEVTAKAGPVVRTAAGVQTVAFLGDYLPRKCGIATFTSDLLGAVAARHPLSSCFAVPVNDVEGCYRYPDVVRFEIEEQDLDSYRRAADFLNSSNVDVVSVQHEFGIFGGPAGAYLLALLRDLNVPAVTTLHTVLLKPNADQYRVMQKLIAHSTRLVVMTERGRTILRTVYQAPHGKIDLIPHGIPDVPFFDPEYYKGQFGVGGKKVLLTFGLLSPNKGIEHVINALPEIVAEFPDVVYIVLGATHPHELRARGEAYRLSLEDLVDRNGLANNVIFHNRFVDLRELTEFIGAADLYITPYLDEAQITSGTLAYAFGAGKAVISTPYWHAAELLSERRGILVPFADPRAIAREASGLLRDERRRQAMSDTAYKLGRTMVWSNIAQLYMRSFEKARRQEAAASDMPSLKGARIQQMNA